MSPTFPPIVMTLDEHTRLSLLAGMASTRHPDIGDDLIRELDRARIVRPEEIGPATVTMGAEVEFAYRRSGIRRVVTLVFPSHADIAKGRISVLTPVGTALIGLSEGQSITFRTPHGDVRTIVVLKVRRPELSAKRAATARREVAMQGGE